MRRANIVLLKKCGSVQQEKREALYRLAEASKNKQAVIVANNLRKATPYYS
jgi:hypothetical protein